MGENDDIKSKLTEVTPSFGRNKGGERSSNYKVYLVVIDGWDEGMEFEIEDFPAFIGRDDSCQVCIPLPSVSREHAIISLSGDKFTIRDHNSTNGTYVNNKLITESELKNKDEITIGEVTLKFIVEKKKENGKVYIIDDK